MATFYHAHLQTANFEFDVYGETEAHAAELMRDAWNAHASEYRRCERAVEVAGGCGVYSLLTRGGAPLEWDVEVRPVTIGALYRDREELRRPKGATFPVVRGGKVVCVTVPEE